MAAVLIVDAAYLLKGARRLGQFDYVKLKGQLAAIVGEPFAESHYLNSVPDLATAGQDRFHDFLRAPAPRGAGFTVHLYGLKTMDCECPHCGTGFAREVQKGVDVGIATLILTLAMRGVYDELVLCAGDGDFADAVAYVVDRCGKSLMLAGFNHSLSTALQAMATSTIRLESHWSAIEKRF